MRKSVAQILHLRTLRSAAANTQEVTVRLHYKPEAEIDEIEDFRIGSGISFFLTFVGGGTVPIELTDVREIRFVNLADSPKGMDASIPVHQIRVAMDNGRVLEGFSADLHSFSGRKSGQEWKCMLKYEAPEHTLCGRAVARIVVRVRPGTRHAPSWAD